MPIFAGIKTPLVLTVVFSLVHGLVGQGNQRARVGAMLLAHRNTDTGTDVDEVLADIDRLGQIDQDSVENRDAVIPVGQIIDDQNKLVAADPGHGVVLAYG